MDFELSDDQLALRDAARALLHGRSPLVRVREVAAEQAHFDRSLWEAMAEQGWPAVERPAEEGGLGLGMVETVVLCEELGRQLAPVPFTGTVLALGALSDALARGDIAADALLGDHLVADWVTRLATGDSIGAVAWSRGSRAVSAVRLVGDTSGPADWALSGRTDPVVYAPAADVVIVFAETAGTAETAETAGHRALFAVAQPEGRRPTPQPAMDVTRSLSLLDLNATGALWLGDAEAAGRVLERAATATSAEMLGCASSALDMSVQYAKDRVQFGRPIGSFQAVKHRCADMLVDLEGMRSCAYYAGWAVGAGEADAPAAASAAKVWCSDASARIMASALQVHGGIGFTWEHDLHLFLKRSQLDQVSFGDATFHRDRLAGILRPRAEAGLPVL